MPDDLKAGGGTDQQSLEVSTHDKEELSPEKEKKMRARIEQIRVELKESGLSDAESQTLIREWGDLISKVAKQQKS